MLLTEVSLPEKELPWPITSILVGQQLNGKSAGGGRSFVVGPGSPGNPTPLVIAGGGGGASFSGDSPAKHGQTTAVGGSSTGSAAGASGGGGLFGDGGGFGGKAFVNGWANGGGYSGGGGGVARSRLVPVCLPALGLPMATPATAWSLLSMPHPVPASLRSSTPTMRGQVVGERQVEQASTTDRQTFSVGQQPAGLFPLRVSSSTQSQTVKVLRQ